MGAAAALVATGTALAVVQPGDLGDETAAPVQETTTTTAGPDLTSTTTIAVTTTTTAGSTTSTTASGGTTTTTVGGSGMGQGGTPSGGADGVADTGGESMIGAGMALGALGLLLRRAGRPRSA